MKVVADSKIPCVKEAFAGVADVQTLETYDITSATIRDADALLVRSETTVDRALLDSARVRFVGTATIGTDHVDTGYLQEKGIAFASAPGSNANSVAEYVVAALLVLSQRLRFDLGGKILGVVGIGNVGSIVETYARVLGMVVLHNDPPRARESESPPFQSLDELMESDIITLHVPLTKAGADKTFHLFDERRIGLMKPGSILINTSRGGVVDTSAARNALRNRHLQACVLDVWENEPAIDTGLLALATLGTPHIAGYSYEGKINGTAMMYRAACAHFGWTQTWSPRDVTGGVVGRSVTIPDDASFVPGLLAAIGQCYDIEADDANLRRMLTMENHEHGAYFRRLRSGYPVRREFHYYEVVISAKHTSLIRTLQAIGFRTTITP